MPSTAPNTIAATVDELVVLDWPVTSGGSASLGVVDALDIDADAYAAKMEDQVFAIAESDSLKRIWTAGAKTLPAVNAIVSVDVTSYSVGSPTTATVRACLSVLVKVVMLVGSTIIGDGLITVIAGLIDKAHPRAASKDIPLQRLSLASLLRRRLEPDPPWTAFDHRLGLM